MERLRYWAAVTLDTVAYRYLNHGEKEIESVNYRQLDEAARATAADLVPKGFAGKRAVLMYPQGSTLCTLSLGVTTRA